MKLVLSVVAQIMECREVEQPEATMPKLLTVVLVLVLAVEPEELEWVLESVDLEAVEWVPLAPVLVQEREASKLVVGPQVLASLLRLVTPEVEVTDEATGPHDTDLQQLRVREMQVLPEELVMGLLGVVLPVVMTL